jgi:hypothetical protein
MMESFMGRPLDGAAPPIGAAVAARLLERRAAIAYNFPS